jgi:hypothetical protein
VELEQLTSAMEELGMQMQDARVCSSPSCKD